MDWGYGCIPYHWILADSVDVARGFYAAVCGYKPELRDELMVFDGGSWTESGRLLRQIGGATFENLILPEKLKADILADVERFFASRAAYEKHGVPWKRGLLFVGPPGNGKTHAIKALINETKRPCLYVKTFDSEQYTDETGIRRVFARARECSPCLLVFEDLDALIDRREPLVLPERAGRLRRQLGDPDHRHDQPPWQARPGDPRPPEPVRPQVPLRPARPGRAAGLHRPVERLDSSPRPGSPPRARPGPPS